ncbi:TonB-dependent receptor [Janthinobacterium sp. HH01]|nr:TonB-dependent receptor [Janthinobacterium sp. HH01]
MIKETVLSRSIRLMFVGGIALGMHAASAQQAPDQPLQKVEVTGSRIPTLNTEGASPVTVLSAKDIKIDGVRNVEDMLNNLPQVFAAQGAAISNGASGTATANLRNLGSDRTLVLVNGKRLPAGSVKDSAPDLNEIPSGLIKRVEVLTGGAGAVYGAGAVSGVINFILRDNFEGVEIQGNIAGFNHEQHSAINKIVSDRGFPVPGNVNFDGRTKDASILMGSNFDNNKGNATLFFTYKETNPVLQSARDFSACSLQGGDAFTCVGSGTQASGRVGAFTNDGKGGVRPYNGVTDAYNFGPLNYLQRPSQMYGFNAQAHYDINDKVRVYQEFGFHNYSTDAQVAPGGIFAGIRATIVGDNPMLTDAWRTALGLTNSPTSKVTVGISKRNVEGGPRIDSINDNSFREVLGVKGEINNWSYDVFGQYARVSHSESNTNYFSAAKIAKAFDVVNVGGVATCASVVNKTDTNCVPYNLYGGAITPAMLNYLSASGINTGYTQQIIVGGTVGADLGVYGIKSPWSSNGIGVSFGLERRAEKLVYRPDDTTLSGDLSGAGGASPPVVGGYSVKEVFAETRVPLLEKKPFADSLDLSGSFRRSEYSTDRSANTYGVGVDWAPVADLVRVRGSYQRAVRAPTIPNLYNPRSIGNSGPAIDPCEGVLVADPKIPGQHVVSASAAACANTGVTAAQYGKIDYNSANQHSSLTGGNPTLAPEEGTTYTLGMVLTPIKNLTMTVDYFKIDIKNTISAVDPSVALNQCLTKGTPAFCALIKRDAFGSLWQSPNGPLGFVEATNANIGSVTTSGVDLGGAYVMRAGTYGTVNFNLNGTYMLDSSVENVPGLGSYDCKGYFGATCGTPTPKWRHKARVTWSTPWKFDMSATWRHVGSTKQEWLSGNEQLQADPESPPAKIEDHLSARNYFDLNVQYPITKKISLSAGINNLFDKDPPTVSTLVTAAAGSANGNGYPQVYDSLGRFIYLNLTARF